MRMAVMAVEMPRCCAECGFAEIAEDRQGVKCMACAGESPYIEDADISAERASICPLREMPQKVTEEIMGEGLGPEQRAYYRGWNDCVAEIGGQE